uniref:30S ribosomal protein S8 n=1 Tax=Nephromyces sp. ex Molgula occidentalis TaxID=2544991 RepID=A0A5C1H9G7_9APIC|nr:30S ribosomal protein S8 [Nephromyces sp. ex Molgula occidentalis]
MTFFNFLIHIKNSYLANKLFWYFPATFFQYKIGKILKQHGFIKDIFWINIKNKSFLYLELNSINNKKFKKINGIKFLKIYHKNKYCNLYTLKYLNNLRSNLYLISTSKGIMSSLLAYKLHLGGKLLCYIW